MDEMDELDKLLSEAENVGGGGASNDNNREPIEKVFTDMKKGAVSSVNPDVLIKNFNKGVINKLPADTGDLINETTYAISDSAEKYEENKDKVLKALDGVLATTSDLLPDSLTTYINKAREWTKGTPISEGYNNEVTEEDRINQQVADIFEIRDDVESELEKSIDDKANAIKNNNQIELLKIIANKVNDLTTIKNRVDTRFYKNSLNLQFRQVLTLGKILNTLNRDNDIRKDQLNAVVKNTALPDMVKVTNADDIKNVINNSMLDGAGNLFSKSLKGNLGDKFKNAIDNIGYSLVSGLEGAKSTGEMIGMSSEMGISKTEMITNMLLESQVSKAMNTVSEKAASMIGEDTNSSKLLKNLQRGSLDPNEYINEAKNKVLKDRSEYDLSVLDSAKYKSLDFLQTLTSEDVKSADYTVGDDKLDDVAIIDNRFKRTITDVIPNLLSNILLEAKAIRKGNRNVDNSDKEFYDFKLNKFINKKTLLEEGKYRIDESKNRYKESVEDIHLSDLLTGNAKLNEEEQKDLYKSVYDYILEGNSISPYALIKNGFLEHFTNKKTKDVVKKQLNHLLTARNRESLKTIKDVYTKLNNIKLNDLNSFESLSTRLESMGAYEVLADLNLTSKDDHSRITTDNITNLYRDKSDILNKEESVIKDIQTVNKNIEIEDCDICDTMERIISTITDSSIKITTVIEKSISSILDRFKIAKNDDIQKEELNIVKTENTNSKDTPIESISSTLNQLSKDTDDNIPVLDKTSLIKPSYDTKIFEKIKENNNNIINEIIESSKVYTDDNKSLTEEMNTFYSNSRKAIINEFIKAKNRANEVLETEDKDDDVINIVTKDRSLVKDLSNKVKKIFKETPDNSDEVKENLKDMQSDLKGENDEDVIRKGLMKLPYPKSYLDAVNTYKSLYISIDPSGEVWENLKSEDDFIENMEKMHIDAINNGQKNLIGKGLDMLNDKSDEATTMLGSFKNIIYDTLPEPMKMMIKKIGDSRLGKRLKKTGKRLKDSAIASGKLITDEFKIIGSEAKDMVIDHDGRLHMPSLIDMGKFGVKSYGRSMKATSEALKVMYPALLGEAKDLTKDATKAAWNMSGIESSSKRIAGRAKAFIKPPINRELYRSWVNEELTANEVLSKLKSKEEKDKWIKWLDENRRPGVSLPDILLKGGSWIKDSMVATSKILKPTYSTLGKTAKEASKIGVKAAWDFTGIGTETKSLYSKSKAFIKPPIDRELYQAWTNEELTANEVLNKLDNEEDKNKWIDWLNKNRRPGITLPDLLNKTGSWIKDGMVSTSKVIKPTYTTVGKVTKDVAKSVGKTAWDFTGVSDLIKKQDNVNIKDYKIHNIEDIKYDNTEIYDIKDSLSKLNKTISSINETDIIKDKPIKSEDTTLDTVIKSVDVISKTIEESITNTFNNINKEVEVTDKEESFSLDGFASKLDISIKKDPVVEAIMKTKASNSLEKAINMLAITIASLKDSLVNEINIFDKDNDGDRDGNRLDQLEKLYGTEPKEVEKAYTKGETGLHSTICWGGPTCLSKLLLGVGVALTTAFTAYKAGMLPFIDNAINSVKEKIDMVKKAGEQIGIYIVDVKDAIVSGYNYLKYLPKELSLSIRGFLSKSSMFSSLKPTKEELIFSKYREQGKYIDQNTLEGMSEEDIATINEERKNREAKKDEDGDIIPTEDKLETGIKVAGAAGLGLALYKAKLPMFKYGNMLMDTLFKGMSAVVPGLIKGLMKIVGLGKVYDIGSKALKKIFPKKSKIKPISKKMDIKSTTSNISDMVEKKTMPNSKPINKSANLFGNNNKVGLIKEPSLLEKSSNKISKAVDGGKSIFNTVKNTVSKSSKFSLSINKLKTIVGVIKKKIISKVGPIAGKKLLGKLAARFVSGPIGLAMTAYDIGMIGKLVLMSGMSLLGATSLQLLGINVFESEPDELLDKEDKEVIKKLQNNLEEDATIPKRDTLKEIFKVDIDKDVKHLDVKKIINDTKEIKDSKPVKFKTFKPIPINNINYNDSDIDMQQLIQDLKIDEGVRLNEYKDSLGYKTIGVGHLTDKRGGIPLSKIIGEDKTRITMEEADDILAYDINRFKSKIASKIPVYKEMNGEMKSVLMNMGFNLGLGGLSKFKTFLKYLKNKDFESAGESLKHSKWYKQVGNRSKRIVARVKANMYNTDINEVKDTKRLMTKELKTRPVLKQASIAKPVSHIDKNLVANESHIVKPLMKDHSSNINNTTNNNNVVNNHKTEVIKDDSKKEIIKVNNSVNESTRVQVDMLNELKKMNAISEALIKQNKNINVNQADIEPIISSSLANF